jgi:hypothetical protein
MAKTTNETQIIVDPDVPLVRIIREFDAPPAKVFRAHADPQLFAQWNGPRGTTATIDHYDCRTGGAWRMLHHFDGGETAFHGSFHEVRTRAPPVLGRNERRSGALLDPERSLERR